MTAVRLGLVGGGQVAQMCHIAPLLAISGVELAAIADLRPGLAGLVAGRYGIPRWHESHTAMLKDSGIDAVVVVTNRAATGAVVRDCLLGGKHVFTEKPMTHTAAQARQLVDLAQARGLILGVAYMKRYDFGFELAVDCLHRLKATAAAGLLRRVHAWSNAGDTCRPADNFAMTAEPRPAGLETWPVAPDWLPLPQHAAYASFLNVHVHALNWLSGMLGSLSIRSAANPGPDSYALEFDAGIPVSLACSASQTIEWSEGAVFEFDHTELRLDFPPPFAVDRCVKVACEILGVAHDGRVTADQWAFARQSRGFIAALRGEQPVRVDAREAMADLQLAEDIWSVAGLAAKRAC